MTVTIPHQLTATEAEKRVKELVNSVKARFGDTVKDIEETWTGDTGAFKFSMSGQPVSGNIRLLPGNVEVDIVLPFLATFFKGKIQSVIEAEGAKLLA